MIILLIGAYLVGSIPFGKLYCRLGNVDIQKRGSGNIGYANVQRIMGSRYGIPTLVSDILKGAVPVYFALMYFDTVTAFAVGMAAIAGHVFPVWLRFRGGKGIATGLGVVGVLSPVAAIIGTAIYMLCVILFGQSSARASGVGVSITAVAMGALAPELWWMPLVLLLCMLYTLRDNFRGKVPDYG